MYVFLFTALAVDDTDGYGQLPGVPEKYHVYTDGIGHLWIEPNSGTVVDYEDQGVSYFIEAATGKRVADIYKWTSRYAPTSKAFKIKQAVAARRYILALELWLPIGLFLGGLLWLVAALKLKPANDPLVSKEMQSTSAGSAL